MTTNPLPRRERWWCSALYVFVAGISALPVDLMTTIQLEALFGLPAVVNSSLAAALITLPVIFALRAAGVPWVPQPCEQRQTQDRVQQPLDELGEALLRTFVGERQQLVAQSGKRSGERPRKRPTPTLPTAGKRIGGRLLALVDAHGGRLRTSERPLAKQLGCSPAGVHKAIDAQVRAGELRSEVSARGTVLTRVRRSAVTAAYACSPVDVAHQQVNGSGLHALR